MKKRDEHLTKRQRAPSDVPWAAAAVPLAALPTLATPLLFPPPCSVNAHENTMEMWKSGWKVEMMKNRSTRSEVFLKDGWLEAIHHTLKTSGASAQSTQMNTFSICAKKVGDQ